VSQFRIKEKGEIIAKNDEFLGHASSARKKSRAVEGSGNGRAGIGYLGSKDEKVRPSRTGAGQEAGQWARMRKFDGGTLASPVGASEGGIP
jgi:hypothetical protein